MPINSTYTVWYIFYRHYALNVLSGTICSYIDIFIKIKSFKDAQPRRATISTISYETVSAIIIQH